MVSIHLKFTYKLNVRRAMSVFTKIFFLFLSQLVVQFKIIVKTTHS